MNVLLDTHIALWAITDSPKLSQRARELIEAQDASVWVSAASVWEIAIKHSLGRDSMPISGREAMAYFRESGYQLLDITAEHTASISTLPMHHQDPFDRILIAQALYEPMRLITRDAVVARYSDTIIEV